MRRALDLADIQGNIVRPYGRFGFPFTRHFFFNIAEAAAGRRFVDAVRQRVTTAERWGAIDDDPDPHCVPRPTVTVNIGFSFRGLLALELPTRTLSALPEEFIDGMAKRWSIIGDFGESGRDTWDPIWRDAGSAPEKQVHVWVSLNAQAAATGAPAAGLAEMTARLQAQAGASGGGVTLLEGHRGEVTDFQDSSAVMERHADGSLVPTAREHFGFVDGIGDPVFRGQFEPEAEQDAVIGSGKIGTASRRWEPLATGEFILGHVSEAQELPATAPPWSFMRNGTFMAYRKLHQNVGSFHAYVAQQAALLCRLGRATDMTAAGETIKAKMAGRWRSGIPLAVAPSYADAQRIEAAWTDIPALQRKGSSRTPAEARRLLAYETMLADFRYAGDEAGARCPVGAHIRRTNPRDALDPLFGTKDATPNSALTNRRRILRRGAPYGDASAKDDAGEHGVIFMALCGSLFRQFEFVQQQWVHYGSSFNAGNDTDPLVGLRRRGAKFVINAPPGGTDPPFICGNMPPFVTTRGGEYFFIPSLTALREIAQGVVDPT